MSNQDIRPYGPGKFNTMVDEYVYQVSFDGCDEDVGGVAKTGAWYGIMRDGNTIFKDHDPYWATLTEAEKELLQSSAGVIICEDFHGFVTVDYFTNSRALEVAWALIVKEYKGKDDDTGTSS